MTDLLPCPFCGGEADFTTRPNQQTKWGVMCDDCTAYRVGDTRDAAIIAWNRRSESYSQFINGMEAAAQICGSLAETTYDDTDAFEAATGCEAAIMAVVKEKRQECADNVEWEGPLTAEEQAMIDAAWEKHKAAGPASGVDGQGLLREPNAEEAIILRSRKYTMAGDYRMAYFAMAELAGLRLSKIIAAQAVSTNADLLDEIAEAISDTLDMDWQPSWAAPNIMTLINRETAAAHAAGRAEERAKVVAWLRGQAAIYNDQNPYLSELPEHRLAKKWADAIERGQDGSKGAPSQAERDACEVPYCATYGCQGAIAPHCRAMLAASKEPGDE